MHASETGFAAEKKRAGMYDWELAGRNALPRTAVVRLGEGLLACYGSYV
jgi:hypothetical protein